MSGKLADLFRTVDGEPQHPSHVLIIETSTMALRVFLHREIRVREIEQLEIGRRIWVAGAVILGAPRELVHIGNVLDVVQEDLH